MSRKGELWDNAVAGRFFGSLRTELIHNKKHATIVEARKDIFDCVEVFYSKDRLHSTLGYVSLEEYEKYTKCELQHDDQRLHFRCAGHLPWSDEEEMTEQTNQLRNAIAEALAQSKPLNEACTCLWIIQPLLRAIGYKLDEILPQGTDAINNYPDYTILPDTEWTWFLEAKAWSTPINNNHVNQALTYAFTNNRRWVVLTNGQEWRLYDRLIESELPKKLVAEMRLQNTEEAVTFLRAISRESVVSSRLEIYARNSRLATILNQEMSTEDSETVKAVLKVLKTKFGLSGINCADVMEALTGMFQSPSLLPPPPLPPASPDAGSVPPSNGISGNGDTYNLNELLEQAESRTTGRKPVSIQLPDGSWQPASSWIDALIVLVRYLLVNGDLPPLPWVGGVSKKRYFLNSEGKHKGPTASRAFQQISANDRVVFVDTNRSASNLVAQGIALLKACGKDPNGVALTIASL